VAVSQGEGLALDSGVEAAGAAQVEDLGLAVEDGGDDLGGAGQAAGLAGGDLGVGAQGGGAQAVAQRGQVDGDQDGGGIAAVSGQLGGVEVFEQGAERLPEALVVARLTVVAGLAG
jgi:hypothetical protein